MTEEEKKQIISDYMRNIAYKGVKTTKERYGKSHYKKMAAARWHKNEEDEPRTKK